MKYKLKRSYMYSFLPLTLALISSKSSSTFSHNLEILSSIVVFKFSAWSLHFYKLSFDIMPNFVFNISGKY